MVPLRCETKGLTILLFFFLCHFLFLHSCPSPPNNALPPSLWAWLQGTWRMRRTFCRGCWRRRTRQPTLSRTCLGRLSCVWSGMQMPLPSTSVSVPMFPYHLVSHFWSDYLISSIKVHYAVLSFPVNFLSQIVNFFAIQVNIFLMLILHSCKPKVTYFLCKKYGNTMQFSRLLIVFGYFKDDFLYNMRCCSVLMVIKWISNFHRIMIMEKY